MRKLIFILFLSIFSAPILGQTDSELPQPSAFIKHIQGEFAKGAVENSKWVKNEFSLLFLNDSLPEPVQDTVISYTLKLMKSQIKTTTGVLGYLKGVEHMLELDSMDMNTWNGWHLTIGEMMENRKWRKKLISYLQLSEELLSSQFISSSKAFKWRFDGGKMEFGVDSLPYVSFTDGKLVCYAKGDSSRVIKTSGRFFPTLNSWSGESGIVPWENTLFNDSLNYAVLGKYSVGLNGTTFKASPVQYHTELFDQILIGNLTFKVQAVRNVREKIYPRFESNSERLFLEDFFPGMNFDGGIVVKGSRLDGTAVDEEPGVLTIFKEGSLFIRCETDEIMFRPDGYGSTDAAASIYLQEDSIYHPGLSVRFDSPTSTLMFIRTEDGIGMQPFYDSYHNIEFAVEAVSWQIGAPTLNMGPLLSDSRGVGMFRSISNFDINSYNAMMGIGSIHPLAELWHFIKNRNGDGFYVGEYASHLRLNKATVKLMLINLALEGYISYDADEEWCVWLDKADDHRLCKKGARDFDVISFRSEIQTGSNAVLGLSNLALEINGLQSFRVSDAQNVIITPKDGQIIMSEDRDFRFGGSVKAGKFEFTGSRFNFNYDEFLVELNSVEQMHIRAEVEGEYDSKGNPKTRLIRNSIDGITGTLEIDHPTNKSGWKSEHFTDYPRLSSKNPSFVYYDSYSIHKGAYHRNRFKYALDPFDIDSLDNFVKSNVRFTGELIAGGIIPNLNEDLRLMDDFSLGLEATSPPGGYPLYEGLGTVTADFTLNMSGLQSTGVIDYLSSHMTGDNIVLVPDSAFGKTTYYINDAVSNHVPKVESTLTDFALHSDTEHLDVRSTMELLACFGEDAVLDGAIRLDPSGMTAEGEFTFEGAHIDSKLFNMQERGMHADVANFEIVGDDLNALAFKTTNVEADIDFDERVGDFVSHAGITQIELPSIRYLCSMDQFRWFMDLDQIQLENTLADENNYNFTSTHPDQDSLSFASAKALYKVREAVIECNDVPNILVADSEIVPDSGLVVVRRDAQMDPLRGAEIFTTVTNRYHRFYDATIQVKGRRDYSGAGSYLYTDIDSTEWPIYFDQIEVENDTTLALGRVPVTDQFFLNPHFEFSGNVNIVSTREHLEFDGGTRLQYKCSDFNNEWVEFTGVIDPLNVSIPVEETITEVAKAHLDAGIMLSDDSPYEAYPLFFTRKPDRGDIPVFKPEGVIRFDTKKKRYLVCNPDKHENKDLPGNVVELPQSGCGVYSSGMTTLPLDFSLIDHVFVGDAWVDEGGGVNLRGSLALNIYFDDKIGKHISDQVRISSDAAPLNFNATNYEQALKELIGVEETAKAIESLTKEGGYRKVPAGADHTMMLTGLEFKYDKYEDSFVSTARIGIATIGNNSVFRSLPGRVELARDRGRDVLRIYLHLSEGHWYYFEYDTFLNFETNDMTFMEVWNKLKDDEKRLNKPGTEQSLKMQVSRSGLRDDFVDRYRDF